MKLTTTLKLLRDNQACVGGYNKVVRSLQGLPFDESTDREKYIKLRHTDEIALLSILDSNGLMDTVWALRATVQNSDRIARLIGVKCAREVQHLMTDPRSIAALDVSERYANGAATEEELTDTRDAAWDAARDAAMVTGRFAAGAATWAARAAAWDATKDAMDAAAFAAGAAAWDATTKRQEEIIRSFLQEE